MVVCAEPVLPADGRRVWEPVDLDAGAEGAEGDGVTLVAHDHVIPHRAGTTGKILKVSGDLHLIAHNCPQLPTISTIQKVYLGKSPRDAVGETTKTRKYFKYAWADKEETIDGIITLTATIHIVNSFVIVTTITVITMTI